MEPGLDAVPPDMGGDSPRRMRAAHTDQSSVTVVAACRVVKVADGSHGIPRCALVR